MLTHSIIDSAKICLPLEAAVQSAILNNAFVDLKAVLPAEIASSDDDTKLIIYDCLPRQLCELEDMSTHGEYIRGITVLNSEMCLFCSAAMVMNASELMGTLVEKYSKLKAKDIVEGSTSSDMIPISQVAKCIADQYPELSTMQQQYDSRLNVYRKGDSELQWEREESDLLVSDGPLVEFCRRALFTDKLQQTCSRAVKAEVDRLQSTRHGVSVSTSMNGAARMQNTEEAFESSFKEICYLLQLFSKSIDAVGKIADEKTTFNMKKELLIGCGSCLAKRITEYCLFKNGTDDNGGLVFQSTSGSEAPTFHTPVDKSTLAFPFISLQSKPDKNGTPRDPLAHLESLFPGGIGLGLSRMWSLCSEKDMEEEREDRLDAFQRHLQDVCLTTVGIPFAIIDKKNEKRLLADRRQALLHVLESSFDKEQVWMIVVVLIYQLVKSSSVAGKLTIQAVLAHFGREKKIPQVVTEALLKLQMNDCSESDELLSRVKTFGSAKNTKALSALSG